MVYWGIVALISVLVVILPYIKGASIKKYVPVRSYFRLFLFIGWFVIGISVFALGAACIFLFIKDTFKLASFIMIPLATLIIMLDLEQYLPWASRYTQSGISETIEFCVGFFKMAKKSMRLASGWLSPFFYMDKRIIDSLKDAKRRKVKIEIAFEHINSEIQDDVIRVLSFLDFGSELIPIQHMEGPHFMIIDNEHIRVEKDHHLSSRYSKTEQPSDIENQVQYFTPMAAFGLNRRFDKFIRSPVDIDVIIKGKMD